MALRRKTLLQPLFPAYVVNEKDAIETMQHLGMHYCRIATDTPMYGVHTKIHDCIEDLKGRYILRRDDIGVQVAFCPVCGKRARTRP
jgi:hypothetical protein